MLPKSSLVEIIPIDILAVHQTAGDVELAERNMHFSVGIRHTLTTFGVGHLFDSIPADTLAIFQTSSIVPGLPSAFAYTPAVGIILASFDTHHAPFASAIDVDGNLFVLDQPSEWAPPSRYVFSISNHTPFEPFPVNVVDITTGAITHTKWVQQGGYGQAIEVFPLTNY